MSQERELRKGSGLFSTIEGSLSLFSSRQKIALTLPAVATLVINALDIVAISLLSLIGAIAIGESKTDIIPWLNDFNPTTLVNGLIMIVAAVFSFKSISGIFPTKIRQNFWQS